MLIPDKLLTRISIVYTLCVVFCMTILLCCLNNDSPVRYHPDEASKVAQVLGDTNLNYNHPQLLLETTRAWAWVFGVPQEGDTCLHAGRSVSAFFAASGVLWFAATGYLIHGWVGLVLMSTFMVLCPPLLAYGHYFKEDAALAFGVSACTFAVVVDSRLTGSKWEWLGAAGLGLSAALAGSAKYVGLVVAGLFLATLFAREFVGFICRNQRAELPARFCQWMFYRPCLFAVFFASVFAVINWRALQNCEAFIGGFTRETEHGLSGHLGLTMNRPNGYALTIAIQQTVWPVWTGMLACAATTAWSGQVSRPQRNRPWRAMLWAIFLTWVIALSFNTVPFTRYALPLILLAHVLAAIGMADVVALVPARRGGQAFAGGLCILAFATAQVPACVSVLHGFDDDGRQHLRQWLHDHVGENTVLVADPYLQLAEAPDPRSSIGQNALRIRLRTPFDPAHGPNGTVATLAAQGVRYVTVCDLNSDRYTSAFTKGVEGKEGAFTARRAFYLDLQTNYPLVWSWLPDPALGTFNNPIIYVYRIDGRINDL